MYSPVKNGKSILRAVRIPHDLDEQIRLLCNRHSLSYSGCLIKLAWKGMENTVGNRREASEDWISRLLMYSRGTE